MSDYRIIESSLDASVNHVVPSVDGGYYEARYVRRVPDRWICYLSSHSGCDKACRFCHLTATGQTMMRPASMADYIGQANAVFETHRRLVEGGAPHGSKLHYNYMARGEPLENPSLLGEPGEVCAKLGQMARQRGLDHAHKVSTIIPGSFRGRLPTILADPKSQLYYSIYSVNPKFRKRWLPKAMPAREGLDLVADYQSVTGRTVVLHWAFIEGENDGERDLDALLEEVSIRGIRAKFNLVRYNPHDGRHGREPDEARLQVLFDKVAASLGGLGSRIVPRVGFDVSASCGMFVDGAAA